MALLAYFYRISILYEIEFTHPWDKKTSKICAISDTVRDYSDYVSLKHIDDSYLAKLETTESNPEVLDFWGQLVNFEDVELELDTGPIIVTENTNLTKVHFMFLMLRLT